MQIHRSASHSHFLVLFCFDLPWLVTVLRSVVASVALLFVDCLRLLLSLFFSIAWVSPALSLSPFRSSENSTLLFLKSRRWFVHLWWCSDSSSIHEPLAKCGISIGILYLIQLFFDFVIQFIPNLPYPQLNNWSPVLKWKFRIWMFDSVKFQRKAVIYFN